MPSRCGLLPGAGLVVICETGLFPSFLPASVLSPQTEKVFTLGRGESSMKSSSLRFLKVTDRTTTRGFVVVVVVVVVDR